MTVASVAVSLPGMPSTLPGHLDGAPCFSLPWRRRKISTSCLSSGTSWARICVDIKGMGYNDVQRRLEKTRMGRNEQRS